MKRFRYFLNSLGANFIPFLEWSHELRASKVLKADLIAGSTVVLVLVPQSMAYAQLAGLPPHYGLYASFLPVVIAAIFGSSRQLATGPVAVISLLTASALGPIAVEGSAEYLGYAVSLALVVGLVQIILGVVRLGIMVAFLSHPVVIGFTNAAAIIIATSQLGKIFGVSVENAEHHYETVWMIVQAAAANPHWLTVGMAMLALLIMGGLRYFYPRMPGILIAVVVTILLSWSIGFEELGGKVVGSIPEGLPGFVLPELKFQMFIDLLGAAMAIALIGFAEAISVAKAMAVQTRQRLDADQELIGQGLSNITASMFQGYAVSGSFSRSAVNIESGAKTGFSSIVTGAMAGLTLLFLTPLLYHLPQATLAAVIIMAVAGLIHVRAVVDIWKVQKHDAIVTLVSFVLTLLYAPHLETGILAGILLSLGLYVYRTMHPRISILSRHKDGRLRDAETHILKQCPMVSIIQFDGSLFFANTSYFENRVLDLVASMPQLHFIIIDAVAINEIDATGEDMLRRLSRILVEQNIALLFTRTHTDIMDTFKKTGFAGPDWVGHFFTTRDEAINYALKQLKIMPDAECALDDCMKDRSGCVLRHKPRRRSMILKQLYGTYKRTDFPGKQ